MAETSAGSITMTLELLLQQFQARLQQAKQMAEQALGGLNGQTVLQASFDISDLQRDMDRARGLIAEASGKLGTDTTLALRVRLDALQQDLGQAEQMVNQAMVRVREAAEVQIRVNTPAVAAEMAGAEASVEAATRRMERDATVRPRIDINRLESQLALAQTEMAAAFGRADARAVIQAKLRFDRLQSDLVRAELVLQQGMSRLDADAVVDVRARLDGLNASVTQAQATMARGFKQAADQAVARVTDLNRRGGAELESFGQKARQAFDFRNFINNPLFNASFWLFLLGGVISTGLGTIRSLTQAINGDWEKAGETIKGIPGGVGAIATEVDEALKSVTGFNAEVEKFERLNQVNALRLSIGVAFQAGTREALDEIEDAIDRLKDKQQELNTPRAERDTLRIDQQYRRETEAARRQAEEKKAGLAIEKLLTTEELKQRDAALAAQSEIGKAIADRQQRINELQAAIEKGQGARLLAGEDPRNDWALTNEMQSEQQALAALEQKHREYQDTLDIGTRKQTEARAEIDKLTDARLREIEATRQLDQQDLSEQQKVDAQRRQLVAQQDILDVESEIRQQNYRAEQNNLAARLEEIARFWDRRVALAEDATAEEIAAMNRAREADIDEARRRDELDRTERRVDAEQNLEISVAELNAEQLRQQGSVLQAELNLNHARFEQRIKAAEALSDSVLADTLRQQRDVEANLIRLREMANAAGEDFTDSIGLPFAQAVSDALASVPDLDVNVGLDPSSPNGTDRPTTVQNERWDSLLSKIETNTRSAGIAVAG